MKPQLRRESFCLFVFVLVFGSPVHAADITKDDNTNALSLGTSWLLGAAPGTGDIAIWSGTYNTAGSLSATYASNLDLQGIQIGNITGTAAGLVTIGGTAAAPVGLSVTIGSSGIDMSAANQNLVINAVTFTAGANQIWNVAAGRNLRFGSTGTGGSNAKMTGTAGLITVTGGGVVDLNQGGVSGFADAAGFAGFTGKWMINSNTTLRGLRNGTTAFGSSTAADAITLNGGTLAVGGISGTQGNWTWNTPITLATSTSSKIDQQIFSGTGRSLKLMGPMTGSGNVSFLSTGSVDAFSSQDLGYIIASPNTMSGTLTIGGATENGVANRLTFVRVGGNLGATDTTTTVGSSGDLGTASIVLNGVLTLSRNNTWTFANNITSGTGILRIGVNTGSATHIVTVSGNNQHTGGTTLQSAVTLNIGSASALGSGTFTIAGNGIFDNTTGSPQVLPNALTLSNGSPTFTGTNDLTFGGAVTLSGANRTITVTNSTATLTLSGAIGQDSNRNFTKAGAGTLVLENTNTYTGTTTVSDGSLRLNGNTNVASAVAVNNTSTLAGNGTVNGTLAVASNATLSPGATANSAGTFTVAGATTMAGTYVWELAVVGSPSGSLGGSSPSATQDRLSAGSTLNMTTAVIVPTALTGSGFNNTQPYSWIVATSTGALSGTPTLGTPAGADFADLAGGAFSISTDANNVYVNFTPVPEPALLSLAVLALAFRRGLKGNPR